MQTVNFYLKEYRPKPLSFDSRMAGLTVAIFIVIIIIYGVNDNNQLLELRKISSVKKSQLEALQEDISLYQKELSVQHNKESTNTQLNNYQNELNSYHKLISIVKNPLEKKSLNYSVVLMQLAALTNQSVWLTKIELDKNQLNLYGSSMHVEEIPIYVDQLKKSGALKRQFDELTLERDDNNFKLTHFSLINGKLIYE